VWRCPGFFLRIAGGCGPDAAPSFTLSAPQTGKFRLVLDLPIIDYLVDLEI